MADGGRHEYILAEDDAHHIVGLAVVHRHPAVHPPFSFHARCFLDGQGMGGGKSDGARGHHLSHGFLAELEDVGDYRFLIGLDFAGFSAEAGNGFEFFCRDLMGLVAVGHQAGHELRHPDQWLEEE